MLKTKIEARGTLTRPSKIDGTRRLGLGSRNRRGAKILPCIDPYFGVALGVFVPRLVIFDFDAVRASHRGINLTAGGVIGGDLVKKVSRHLIGRC